MTPTAPGLELLLGLLVEGIADLRSREPGRRFGPARRSELLQEVPRGHMAHLLAGGPANCAIRGDDPDLLAVAMLRGEPLEDVVGVRGIPDLQRPEGAGVAPAVEHDDSARALQRDKAGEGVDELSLIRERSRVQDVVSVEEVQHGPLRMPELQPEADYLEELTHRLRSVLGDELLGAYAGGSFALGDYDRSRSDLDISAVTRDRTPAETALEIVAAIRHEVLPSPARGLEFVLYPLETARAGGVEPGYDLNLNSGRGLDFRADLEPVASEAHWFAIDRSVLDFHGVALAGPPARKLFRSAGRSQLLPLLAETLRWFLREGSLSEDAVLNACRSLFYAREGTWTSKHAAGRWAGIEPTGMSPEEARELIERAIAELEAG
jgi:predicted nucleotidyltransferase